MVAELAQMYTSLNYSYFHLAASVFLNYKMLKGDQMTINITQVSEYICANSAAIKLQLGRVTCKIKFFQFMLQMVN